MRALALIAMLVGSGCDFLAYGTKRSPDAAPFS